VAFFCSLSSVFFGSFVYFGTRVVDFLNRLLMAGLVLGYLGLIVLGISHVHPALLAYQNWPSLGLSLPLMVTSFGYHIIIPTLSTYLEHDVKRLKKAIWIGSLIPLLFYIAWQFLALGIIPVEGEISLQEAFKAGMSATFFLQKIIGSPLVSWMARGFAFFAIITSLLGVSLSLSDFLADGLKIKKNPGGKLFLTFLTFMPPLLFALFYPKGFIKALHYAALFVVILLILIPCLMAWMERYGPKTERSLLRPKFTVWGGKGLIVTAILLSCFLLFLEVYL